MAEQTSAHTHRLTLVVLCRLSLHSQPHAHNETLFAAGFPIDTLTLEMLS